MHNGLQTDDEGYPISACRGIDASQDAMPKKRLLAQPRIGDASEWLQGLLNLRPATQVIQVRALQLLRRHQ